MEAITNTEYQGFQKAYDFFNKTLFDNSLPAVLVTLQRHAKAKGYFSPKRFTGRVQQKAHVDELALNPDAFTGRTDSEILSTLVHEMCHVWQEHHGERPSGRYHDRQWAAKMKEIGLQPTDTGKPGGKETGQSVSHYIVADSRFTKACIQFQATGFRLNWQSAPADPRADVKRASKTKYICPNQGCGATAWGKPGLVLICGECYLEGLSDDADDDIQIMLAEVV
jgi:predicted SprT family Zn-dependent metalloprotease